MLSEKQYKRIEALLAKAEKLVSILEARFDPCPVQKAQEELLADFEGAKQRFEELRESKIAYYPCKGSGIHEKELK